jgi:hypothetical protein
MVMLLSSVARSNFAKIPIKKNNNSGRNLNVTNLVTSRNWSEKIYPA